MKDKDKISILLRAFKSDNVDFDYSLDFLLQTFSNSKRFNYFNFQMGFITGMAFIIIWELITK